jgi:hypothetical protein
LIAVYRTGLGLFSRDDSSFQTTGIGSAATAIKVYESDRSSVADPDLIPDPDPHIFGPPGSGSGSFYHHAKIVRKTLIPTVPFCDSF